MSSSAIQKVREAGIWINAAKVAVMLGCSSRWVQKNRDHFEHRRKGEKLLEFELSSVIKYHENQIKSNA